LVNVTDLGAPAQQREIEAVASTNGVAIITAQLRTPLDIDPAFERFARERVQAIIVPQDTLVWSERKRIAALAAAAKLPAIYGHREHVDVGGLISYGISLRGSFRRAASYVDRILRGAKPADLPIEFPTTFELVVNGSSAKSLGVTIPPAILLRADEVIE
jgi:putative tryptophan/tyrosine transport system substrate-binding protein